MQQTIHVQPLGRALLLHLKRYDYETQRKLNEPVFLDRVLTFGTARYEFTALIEHQGRSMQSGHYVAYVRSTNYWLCNDKDVVQVTWNDVEKRQAYLLAYVRVDT